MNPYIDLASFKAGTLMPSTDVDVVEQIQPGFFARRFAFRSSELNAAARKRYGNAGCNLGNHIPFGQIAPALVPSGLNPPSVTLVGRPVLGSLRISIQIITGGALGTATFAWSTSGGDAGTWLPNAPAALLAGAGVGIATGTLVQLGTTGLSVQFGAGNYSGTNAYNADTPVPGAILTWLISVVTFEGYVKRGTDPQDPGMTFYKDLYTEALTQIKQAADGKDGLLDLPISEDLGSAVTTGGVESYAEQSPYTWTDREEHRGRREDERDFYG